jgi:anti-sigma B factor antagonist
MNLPTEIFGSVVVIHAPEELGADQTEAFRKYVTSQERQNVVLDIDNSESISSDGLASLLDSQDQLRERSGDLKITTANIVNRKILEVTRLDQQLQVFDSVIDAVKSFR